jgi:hypothetical protein
MSVERIFRELADPSTWPEPPPRPVRPATAADLRPAVLIPVSPEQLERWAPTAHEITDGWPRVAGDRS